MIEIEITGSRCRFSSPVPMSVESKIDESLKMRVAGCEYINAFKSGDWDGYTHLYKYRKFPIGLLSRVEMILHMMNKEYEIYDFRRDIEFNPIEERGVLREYQKSIVDSALTQERGLIQAPTGSGKTIMFASIMSTLGLPTIVIVPTVDLVNQTISAVGGYTGHDPVHITTESLQKHGFFKEFWDSGVYTHNPENRLENGCLNGESGKPFWAVATWQTINSLIRKHKKREYSNQRKTLRKFFGMFSAVIVDEAHYVGADKVYEVLMRIPARYRYGFSATPWRTDNAEIKMNGAIGEISTGITASDLIRQGYLVKPTIKFLNVPRPQFDLNGSWREVYSDYVVHNDDRNEYLANKAIDMSDDGRIVLVMVTQLNHGEYMKQLIPDSVFINGSLSKKKRKQYSDDFRDGKIPIMISSNVFNVGVDFPILSGGVMAAPFKSAAINVQRVGRFLRIHEDKEDSLIYETLDSVMYMREWSLSRKNMYEEEELFDVR